MTNLVNRATSRSDLAAVTPRAAGDVVYLAESGREGLFVWDSADRSAQVAGDPSQGVFVPPSGGNGSSGAWVRRFEDCLRPEWFGAKPDGTTDNSDALDGLLDFVAQHAQANDNEPTSPGSYRVQFGKGRFYFSRRHAIRTPIIIEGVATANGWGSPGTWLDFAAGGFVVERYNTTGGDNSGLSPTGTGGDGTIFRNLYLSSRQARPSDANYAAQAADGIRSWARIDIDTCVIRSFTRDGIHLESSLTNYTNVNCARITDTLCQMNGRHGLALIGVDANACNIMNCSFDFNNNWGVFDDTFLSNHHFGHHASCNGWPGAMSGHKGDSLSSVCFYPATPGASTVYYVSPGKSVQASTTTPGTDPTVWVKQSEGAGTLTPNGALPVWATGMTWKEGGSYYVDGIQSGMMMNCYAEGGQGAPFAANGATAVFGGEFDRNPNSLGTYVYGGENGYLRSTRGWGVQHLDPVTGKETRVVLGRRVGSLPDEFFQVYNTDYFPGSGFMGTLYGGNILFGTSQDYPHIGFIGPNSPFTWPSYPATRNTSWFQMIAMGERPHARLMTFGNAPPANGSWDQGAIILNSGASAGGKIGWVCTAAGAPGTWKAFGAIDA